mmetsp:Transcript_11923/g.16918  ORF Transcript_11923/g.16918 Transcript_11923/m.16918 type:complete len:325 (+) Transcript_11923:273-1247(+)
MEASSESDGSGGGGGGAFRSPTLNVQYKKHKRREKLLSSEDDDSEEQATFDDLKTATPKTPSPRRSPPCPSEVDAITLEKLPKLHVCFVSPDASSRQCFALSTLHTIAMKSTLSTALRHSSVDGKPTFLQPPHFRSRMSADLIDQIAARFGRESLDLSGDYYNRPQNDGDHENQGDHRSFWSPTSHTMTNLKTFEECLKEYMTKVMGSNDLYCCPVCYTEAQHRLASTDEDLEDDDSYDNTENQYDEEMEEQDMLKSKYTHQQDPMAILGYLDNEEFKLASTFCFTRISHVKEHLRECHNIDPSILDGNDLYKRFKVCTERNGV